MMPTFTIDDSDVSSGKSGGKVTLKISKEFGIKKSQVAIIDIVGDPSLTEDIATMKIKGVGDKSGDPDEITFDLSTF